MQELLDKIGKLTGAQKLAASLAVYALVAAGLWFALISPTRTEIQAAHDEQDRLEGERDENRDIAENRDRWEKNVERLNEELAKAIKELPNEREIPELLRRVSSIGKKIGLEFLLFQPLPENPRDFYAEVPVKLKIEGSYHEVATFFDRIGKLNRIVNVRDISLHDPAERGGKIVLTIEGTAVTYRFLTASEVGAGQPREARPRGGGGGGEEE
jgi:type IV pilus assembly protein PilO